MPFTGTITTWNSGDVINATELAQSHQNARDYLNNGIISSDIKNNSITNQEIIRGDAFIVNDDHLFDTGDHFTCNGTNITKVGTSFKWHTSTIKTVDPQQNVRFVSIPGLGKSIYLEDEADVLINISFWAKEEPNTIVGTFAPFDGLALTALSGISGISTGPINPRAVDSKFRLSVNGVTSSPSESYSFAEDGVAAPTSNSVADPLTKTVHQNSKRKRIYMSQSYILSPGWHQIAVVVDPRNEVGKVGNFNCSFEVFYRCGYRQLTDSQRATTIKQPSTIF